jgi:flagellar basal body-associated protein FliL
METLLWVKIILVALLAGVVMFVVFVRGADKADRKSRRWIREMGDEVDGGASLPRGERPRSSRIVLGVLVFLAMAAFLAAVFSYAP